MSQTDREHSPLIGRLTPNSLRAQLLLSVNFVLFVLFALMLGYDYQREMDIRLRQRQSGLQEEAESLLQACRVIGRHGSEAIQRYIDDVCATAHDKQSPGHHIVVEIAGNVFQAKSHGRQSSELLHLIREAAREVTDEVPADARIVVGTSGQKDLRVYVAESVSDIHRLTRRDTLTRSAALLGVALVTAVIINLAIGHFVTRPIRRLVAVVKRIGQGELGAQGRSFDSEELNYLADEINRMSRNLAEADRDRRTQMEKARSIQKDLLPGDVSIPNVHYSCVFEPADEVGGDYYDILPLSDGSWLFCLADVSGHGVPAAMTAAIVKSLLTEATRQQASPAEILKYINRGLMGISPNGNFVTMALVRFVPESRTLEFVSAGHESGFLRRVDGSIDELDSTGLIVGVSENPDWQVQEFRVHDSERLVLVTDGVTETFGPNQMLFGRNRVSDLLQHSQRESESVNEFVERLHSSVIEFRDGQRQRDDITVVAVQF